MNKAAKDYREQIVMRKKARDAENSEWNKNWKIFPEDYSGAH